MPATRGPMRRLPRFISFHNTHYSGTALFEQRRITGVRPQSGQSFYSSKDTESAMCCFGDDAFGKFFTEPIFFVI